MSKQRGATAVAHGGRPARTGDARWSRASSSGPAARKPASPVIRSSRPTCSRSPPAGPSWSRRATASWLRSPSPTPARQRGRQVREEPPQDARPAARPARRAHGRRRERRHVQRPHRDRAPGRRRGGDRALDEPGRDAREQDDQRAEVPQRDHPRALAQGLERPARASSHSSTLELDRLGAPRDLVQLLPAAGVEGRRRTSSWRSADLVVATGSQSNIRAAYASGTPAFGVGAGNVAVIVDASADLASAARRIACRSRSTTRRAARRKTALILPSARYGRQALRASMRVALLLGAAREGSAPGRCCGRTARLNPDLIAQDAATHRPA